MVQNDTTHWSFLCMGGHSRFRVLLFSTWKTEKKFQVSAETPYQETQASLRELLVVKSSVWRKEDQWSGAQKPWIPCQCVQYLSGWLFVKCPIIRPSLMTGYSEVSCGAMGKKWLEVPKTHTYNLAMLIPKCPWKPRNNGQVVGHSSWDWEQPGSSCSSMASFVVSTSGQHRTMDWALICRKNQCVQ